MTTTINASTTAGLVQTADTSGVLALQTANTTAVTIDASQNTTLAGTLTTTGITNSGVATATRFNPTGSSVTGNGMYLPAANSLGLSTNGTNAVYIDSSQKVGIGTSSPNANLQVNGGIQVTGTPAIGSTGVGVEIGYGLVNASEGAIQAYNRSGGAWINMAYSALAHKFLANNSEAMRIDSSGNVSIGTTSAVGSPFRIKKDNSTSVFQMKIAAQNDSVTTHYMIGFTNASDTTIGNITSNNSTVSFNTTSDYRLKENIAPMTGALATVSTLKPVTYKWKSTGENGQGFIAHELQAVVPDCVTGEKDAVETYTDENGNEKTRPKYQSIDTSFLVATLTAALQETKTLIDTQAELISGQAATINALVTRIEALENK